MVKLANFYPDIQSNESFLELEPKWGEALRDDCEGHYFLGKKLKKLWTSLCDVQNFSSDENYRT